MSRRSEVDEADARRRADPPIPPKNLSAERGRTASPAGLERIRTPRLHPSFLIILLSQNRMWGDSAHFLQGFQGSAEFSEGLRGVFRGETPLAPEMGINFRPPDARFPSFADGLADRM